MCRSSPKKIAAASFAAATSDPVFNLEVNLCGGTVVAVFLPSSSISNSATRLESAACLFELGFGPCAQGQ